MNRETLCMADIKENSFGGQTSDSHWQGGHWRNTQDVGWGSIKDFSGWQTMYRSVLNLTHAVSLYNTTV